MAPSLFDRLNNRITQLMDPPSSAERLIFNDPRLKHFVAHTAVKLVSDMLASAGHIRAHRGFRINSQEIDLAVGPIETTDFGRDFRRVQAIFGGTENPDSIRLATTVRPVRNGPAHVATGGVEMKRLDGREILAAECVDLDAMTQCLGVLSDRIESAHVDRWTTLIDGEYPDPLKRDILWTEEHPLHGQSHLAMRNAHARLMGEFSAASASETRDGARDMIQIEEDLFQLERKINRFITDWHEIRGLPAPMDFPDHYWSAESQQDMREKSAERSFAP